MKLPEDVHATLRFPVAGAAGELYLCAIRLGAMNDQSLTAILGARDEDCVDCVAPRASAVPLHQRESMVQSLVAKQIPSHFVPRAGGAQRSLVSRLCNRQRRADSVGGLPDSAHSRPQRSFLYETWRWRRTPDCLVAQCRLGPRYQRTAFHFQPPIFAKKT